LLPYWIRERERIRIKKQEGLPKPWSDDPIFQTTYFTNVHREDDKVTRWIRDYYSRWVGDPLFEYNIVFSRFINWPPTLSFVGYIQTHNPRNLEDLLNFMSDQGTKVWGGAYVITTHGIKMPKAKYLCERVLTGVYEALPSLLPMCRAPLLGHPATCAGAANALLRIEGIGSFLAGQIVADLKNTLDHPLFRAEDKYTFSVPGPGSLRGASWYMYGESTGVSPAKFEAAITQIAKDLVQHDVDYVCMQDLQNCLCEFDKYMRIKTGTGRSKRLYDGSSTPR
jgi:hypothetical protein